MSMSTTARSTVISNASGASSGLSILNSIQSRHCMASDIDSTSSEEADLRLAWSRRWTLSHRILALNLITILLVMLSTLYLDLFRNRLTKERVRQTRIDATATSVAIDA